MRRVLLLSFFFAISSATVYGQTCTITGSSPLNWTNPGPSPCTVLVIPAGFTVNFNSSGDTWSGTRIDVYGTLQVSHDATINSSITVFNGGLLQLQAKLSLGSAAGCGYGLSIKPGGTVDVGGSGSDRLNVCGSDIMKGNGSCNSCSGTNSGKCAYNGSPYCEPSGGFTGPLGYDEGGYDVVLPITLSSFQAKQEGSALVLQWSTVSEKNFDKFIIEHSSDWENFDSLSTVQGSGNSKQLLKYSLKDTNPIIGKNYYRLKSVDFDLSFEYSPVIVVEFEGKKNVAVYPNPTNLEFVRVHTNFLPSEEDRIEIYDHIGMRLKEFNVSDYETILQFNSLLKEGSYLLRYVSHNHSQVIRFYCKD